MPQIVRGDQIQDATDQLGLIWFVLITFLLLLPTVFFFLMFGCLDFPVTLESNLVLNCVKLLSKTLKPSVKSNILVLSKN